MLIINKLSGFFHYYFDTFKANSLKAKIEHFILDNSRDTILVVYRLGRKKLLNKMDLNQFVREYFEIISSYDQLRLTKFSMLQNLLHTLFVSRFCNKEQFIKHIQDHVRDEQLF